MMLRAGQVEEFGPKETVIKRLQEKHQAKKDNASNAQATQGASA